MWVSANSESVPSKATFHILMTAGDETMEMTGYMSGV